MAAGEGVSYKALGGDRWRIRWRERTADEAKPWRSRECVFEGPERGTDGAEGYALTIRSALAREGTFNPRKNRPPSAPEVPPASIIDLVEGVIVARVAAGKYRGNTPNTFRSYKLHLARALHAIKGIPKERPLPVSLLMSETFDALMKYGRDEGLSDVMRYEPLRLLMDAWAWAADRNQEARLAGRADPWPGLPPAPLVRKDYLPRAPRHGRTVAPTIEHMDACLRHMPEKASRSTRIAALVMRYTGLRISQVLGIHREDLDLQARTLVVRVGKTEGERADERTVPLSRHLLAERGVQSWIEGIARGPLFGHAHEDGARKKPPAKTLRSAWEAATAANQVPEAVWKPHNRKHSRPDHAFRAGFQAFLTDNRVDGDVVDFLVGHEGESIREQHYGRELLEKARAAVDSIPPVDWTGPQENTENVVAFARSGA